MGKGITIRRTGDDSDVYVTFDPRTRILDVPDDGRVSDLLTRTGTSFLRAPAQLDRAPLE